MLSIDLSQLPESARTAVQKESTKVAKLLEQFPTGECLGGEMTGWYDFPKKHGMDLCSEIQKKVQDLSSSVEYDTVVVIGIGGSFLGTQAIYEALHFAHKRSEQPAFTKKIIFFGQDLCAEEIEDRLDFLKDHTKPLVVAISKSGTTLEPAVGLRLVWQVLLEKYGDKGASQRVIVVTSAVSGKLRTMAKHFGWQAFVVPENVGGRYSVLSAVGLVPLALAGGDTFALTKGGAAFFAEDKGEEHPLFKYVAVRSVLARDFKKTMEVLVFNRPRLRAFVEWWKQLFAESEGKQHKGVFPTGFLTTTDLHSLGQYLQDGQRLMFETFLSFKDQKEVSKIRVGKAPGFEDGLESLEDRSIWELNELVSQASLEAHADGGAFPMSLTVSHSLSFHSLGYLLSFFETACALSGLALGVNPFDQPGVEAYKAKMLKLLKS